MSQAAIEIESLSFAWKKEALTLQIPQLAIQSGERVFIKGRSGSGKSTLLNLLGGMIKPDSGTINVLGKNIGYLSSSQADNFRADRLGVIFQQFNLLPYLNLVENVTLPCRFSRRRLLKAKENYGSLEQAAIELLAELGLDSTELLNRSVRELSTGQQQRVALARALIGQPSLIIADEPTSALDTEHRDRFIELLSQQCERHHSTLLFVSHDESLKKHFSRVEVLQPNPAGGFCI